MAVELNKNLKLNGKNYEAWSMKIQDLLEEQEVLDSLSSVMDKPEEGTTSQHVNYLEAYVAWRKKNSTACIILLSAMDDDIAEQFHIYDNAMDLWIALKDKFGGLSLAKLRTLALKFDTYKMPYEHTMKMHLSEMFDMIKELSDAGHKMTEEQKIQALIRSLADRWDHMRIHLIKTESIRTFEDAARHLELEEDRLTSIKNNVEAQFAGTTSVEKSSDTTIRKCHCFNEFEKYQTQEHKKQKQDHQEGNKPSMNKQEVNITSRMTIFVTSQTGKTIAFSVKSSNTLQKVKAKIHAMEGIPLDQMDLITVDGRRHPSNWTISDCNIQDQDTIYLLLRQCGC